MKAMKLNTKPLAKAKRSVSASRTASLKKHSNEHIKQHHSNNNDNDISNITNTIINKKSKSLSKNSSPLRNIKTHLRKTNSRTSSPSVTVYKVIQNAKDLLTIQTSIIEQCDTLNKQISQTELELTAKLNTNKKHFGSFADTLTKVKEAKCNQCEQFHSFMLMQLNSVNELIGKLGYNYVFHKFKKHNFTLENITTYFANVKQLLISLSEENAKLQNVIMKYNNNNNNEQYSFNNNNNVNVTGTQQTNITTLPCVTNMKEEFNCNNIYTNESSMNMNVFSSGGGVCSRNDNEREMKPEMDIKSNSNNNNNIEALLSQSSNLFDSGTFFAEYKRNKEIRNELELLYTEGNNNNSNSNLVSKNYEEFRIVPNESNLCNTQSNYNNNNNTLAPKQSNKLFFN